MSVYTEFAADVERRRRRLARAQFWFRVKGPISTETFLLAAAFLIALGSFLGGVVAAGRLVAR